MFKTKIKMNIFMNIKTEKTKRNSKLNQNSLEGGEEEDSKLDE
jgi:hypothetical protein